jgi:hypothetical protein
MHCLNVCLRRVRQGETEQPQILRLPSVAQDDNASGECGLAGLAFGIIPETF